MGLKSVVNVQNCIVYACFALYNLVQNWRQEIHYIGIKMYENEMIIYIMIYKCPRIRLLRFTIFLVNFNAEFIFQFGGLRILILVRISIIDMFKLTRWLLRCLQMNKQKDIYSLISTHWLACINACESFYRPFG